MPQNRYCCRHRGTWTSQTSKCRFLPLLFLPKKRRRGRRRKRSPPSKSSSILDMAATTSTSATTSQSVAEKAVMAIGCGYDLANDIRFQGVKLRNPCSPSSSRDCSRLIRVEDAGVRDLLLPGGDVVKSVPSSIRCDKGERTRFRSDVLSFSQMSEHFNQRLSLSGKIPSGLFNSMFDFRGLWQKDASCTKKLAYDGWFITLYSIELVKSELVLHDSVKDDVPSRWDPVALSKFIENYGTHVITGIQIGGKDVIHLKQLHDSSLQPNEMQNLIKKLAGEIFSEGATGDILSEKEIKVHFGPSVVSHSRKHDIISVHVRRGGVGYDQNHKQWLATIPMAPDVISMSFVPISSLLNGVPGSGFLIHAVNHYLRYKPPIEELHQFLEFQLPKQWAPAFGDLPLGRRCKKNFPSLRFSLMGPQLRVNTSQVSSGKLPLTGMRLYLEGRKNDCLAIHLQHLSALPESFQLSEENNNDPQKDVMNLKDYFEPVKWSLFSHVCTAPVQYDAACINDSAFIVSKAMLEVKEVGVKVLFLRLGYSSVANARIRRSEWDGPSSSRQKTGPLSTLFSTGFSLGHVRDAMSPKVELNSGLYLDGPPVPGRLPKMSKFVDTTGTVRGSEDYPGYWLVTGAKLSIENGRILVKAKYSLLSMFSENELPFAG